MLSGVLAGVGRGCFRGTKDFLGTLEEGPTGVSILSLALDTAQGEMHGTLTSEGGPTGESVLSACSIRSAGAGCGPSLPRTLPQQVHPSDDGSSPRLARTYGRGSGRLSTRPSCQRNSAPLVSAPLPFPLLPGRVGRGRASRGARRWATAGGRRRLFPCADGCVPGGAGVGAVRGGPLPHTC